MSEYGIRQARRRKAKREEERRRRAYMEDSGFPIMLDMGGYTTMKCDEEMWANIRRAVLLATPPARKAPPPHE